MNVPTKTVLTPDWEAVVRLVKEQGVVYLADMTVSMTRTLNMWLRVHHGKNLKCRSRLAGGYDITITDGSARKYTKKAA